MTGADIVTEARTWLGTPWVHLGRAKGVGVDCAGLVLETARAVGFDMPADVNYPAEPDGTLLPTCAVHMQPISRAAARAGDVLVFRVGMSPHHLGILADHPHGRSVIHSTVIGGQGKVIEHRLIDDGALRIVAAYRFKELAA